MRVACRFIRHVYLTCAGMISVVNSVVFFNSLLTCGCLRGFGIFGFCVRGVGFVGGWFLLVGLC